jgi:hypothetical protein
MNNYTYDGKGMLTSAGGAQYTYDALQQRVEKTGGSNSEGMIYFNGRPEALTIHRAGFWRHCAQRFSADRMHRRLT